MFRERLVIWICIFILILAVLTVVPSTNAWLQRSNSRIISEFGKPESATREDHSKSRQQGELQFYEYDGAKISYRKYYNLPTSQPESQTAVILLIHPIGIGQASWFWDRFISEWFSNKNTTGILYTVNLLGCGVTTERNAPWNMTRQTQQYSLPEISELPVSLPLMSWVEQCEAMLQQVILQKDPSSSIHILPNAGSRWNLVKNALNQGFISESIDKVTVTIIAQGGLAPVAALLAARNPDIVQGMILTSPPAFDDLTKSVPESELRFNYKALCQPLVEKLAFSVLESQWAIQFFSNIFLFSRPCDSEWINRTMNESGPSVRRAVQLFNAGYCSYRSYEEELKDKIYQPTLILRGTGDNRDCDAYANAIPNCSFQKINGKNVLPWESSSECCTAIKAFLDATI